MTVSVVLPVKNAGDNLLPCVESILAQSLQNFELIIVNDHSTDHGFTSLSKISDSRVSIINNSGEGLVDALNLGIEKSSFDWIARMDSDDLMHPDRLKLQMEYLDNNPDTDCLGCQVELFPLSDKNTGMQRYIEWQNNCITHQDIANNIFVESPFTHPSVVLKKSTLTRLGGYKKGDFPEDYELWLRMHHANGQFAKLPETLLSWRQDFNSTFRTHSSYSEDAFNQVRYEYLLKSVRLQRAKKILIWGAGPKTRRRVRPLINSGLSIIGWIDIDEKKIGQKYSERTVYSPAQALRIEPDLILVCVNNYGARDLISAFLSDYGFYDGIDFIHVG